MNAHTTKLAPIGYKHTEVGVIPQDWTLGRLADFGVFRSGSGFPLSYQGFQSGDYPFFKVSDMNNQGNELFMKNSSHWISEGVRKKLSAIKHPIRSIIFAKVGAAIFLERKRLLSRESCIDNNMMAFSLTDHHACQQFFYYLFLGLELGKLASTTALPSLSGRQIGEISVPLPPPTEQRAIAEALSDMDSLIQSLDALIAKKRAIKQAAMQQLLTGKTRLPGFSGAWERRRIDGISEIDPENLPSDTNPDFTFNYISLEQVDAGQLLGYSEERFRTAPSRARRVLRYGDVLMSTVRPGLMAHLLYHEQITNAVCSTGFAVLRIKTCLSDSGFLFFHLLGHVVNEQVKKALAGSNYPAISGRDVGLLEIPCPSSIQEQRAIAAILSDVDAEIAALERRRDKTRAIKQGMMQQLLTGRMRLPKPE